MCDTKYLFNGFEINENMPIVDMWDDLKHTFATVCISRLQLKCQFFEFECRPKKKIAFYEKSKEGGLLCLIIKMTWSDLPAQMLLFVTTYLMKKETWIIMCLQKLESSCDLSQLQTCLPSR